MGSELIGKQIGNYVVKELLGQGGMGSVYLAEHPRIGRKVAIKVLSAIFLDRPNVAERFETEARIISHIEHPNIVNLFDYGTLEDGRPYYVMERLKGVDLHEVIDREAKFEPDEIYPYLVQICRGLHAAHVRGVVHRDLKPKNIFVVDGPELVVKLLDFGIAKLLESTESGATFTSTGEVIGTPQFISPEQAGGYSKSVGPRTDLYSLGVMLYLMLCGETPFDEEGPVLLMASHLKTPPTDLRDRDPTVSPVLAELVHACLEKDPLDRPISAVEVATQFARAIGVEPDPVLAAEDTLPEQPEQYRHISRELRATATTLQHGTGEKVTALPQGKKRKASTTMLLAVACGLVLFLGGGLYLAQHLRKAGTPDKRQQSPAKPPPLVVQDVPDSGPAEKRTIRVAVTGVAATCELFHAGKRTQQMTAPCRLEVERRRSFKLIVQGEGLRPFLKEWRVDEDLSLVLGPNRATGTLTVRGNSMAESAAGSTADSDVPSTVNKPVRPKKPRKKPPKKPPKKPDTIGEGTLEIKL